MRVFVYGTLRDREVASDVLDDVSYDGSATLDGLHRVDGAYPTLAPGGSVDGEVLVTDDVAALDRYEGVGRDLYVRVPVGRDAGGTVQTYVGDPTALDAPAQWPGTGPSPERVRRYLGERDVRVVEDG